MKYLVLLGRVFYSFIFVVASFGHFTKQTIGYAAVQGVPLASIAVPISGVSRSCSLQVLKLGRGLG